MRHASMRGRPLVVTYHYIRPRNSDGVTGLTPEAFDDQLALIARSRRFIGVDEFIALVNSGRIASEGGSIALVTFDDGLRDQYEHALPVLEQRGVPAVFFAPMRPVDPALDDLERWTPQHLLHALAERLGWAGLEARIRAALGPVEVDAARMNALYHYEEPCKRWLKYVMAFAVPARRAAAILDAINRGDGAQPGPRIGAGEWFMSRGQLADLERRGHALGGHGYDHLPYSTLTRDEQDADMGKAVRLMNSLFGPRARAIAYPFGRFDAHTVELVRAYGYTHAFTTEDRVDCKFLAGAVGEQDQAMAAAGAA